MSLSCDAVGNPRGGLRKPAVGGARASKQAGKHYREKCDNGGMRIRPAAPLSELPAARRAMAVQVPTAMLRVHGGMWCCYRRCGAVVCGGVRSFCL